MQFLLSHHQEEHKRNGIRTMNYSGRYETMSSLVDVKYLLLWFMTEMDCICHWLYGRGGHSWKNDTWCCSRAIFIDIQGKIWRKVVTY
jgi:hypothetical protein